MKNVNPLARYYLHRLRLPLPLASSPSAPPLTPHQFAPTPLLLDPRAADHPVVGTAGAGGAGGADASAAENVIPVRVAVAVAAAAASPLAAGS